LDLWSLASDILFNICLVSLSEETFKCAAHTALYNSTKNEWISALIPIAVWALSHGYVAYTGALQLPLIAAAFAAGIILFLALKHSRSLLLVTLIHGFFNSLILIIATFL